MEQGTSAADGAAVPSVKLCECGCGRPTPIVEYTDRKHGRIKGQPSRFIRGHGAVLARRSRQRPQSRPEWAVQTVVLCECGCGEPAAVAKMTRTERRQVKGQPMRFASGHKVKKPQESRQRIFVTQGQRIGRSVVIDPETRLLSQRPNRSGIRAVRLRCDCGTEYVRAITTIFKKTCLDNEYCGKCNKGSDLTGQRIGRLTVIRWIEPVAGSAEATGRWLCECACGNEVRAYAGLLRNGDCRSCGCAKSGPASGYAPGEGALGTLLADYRRGARDRNLTWDLSREEFARLTSLDCSYCGASPSRTVKCGGGSSGTYTYNGIDRVDNKQGYTSSNCAPACLQCNRSKMDLPYDEWMTWAARFFAFQFFGSGGLSTRLLAAQLKDCHPRAA